MKQRPKILTATFVKTVNAPGRYGDGRGSHGLSLLIKKMSNGRVSKSWSQRLILNGKPVMFGLGSFPVIGLAQAREICLRNKQAVIAGHDPRIKIPTFREAAQAVIKVQAESWTDQNSEMQWRQSLQDYVYPAIGTLPVDRVQANHVLQILLPHWAERNTTMARVKSRISTILQWSIANGYRNDDPVSALSAVLPKIKKQVEHFQSLHHAELGRALNAINENGEHWAIPACIRFIALTASRSGEARGMQWSEINFKAKTWAVPAERMKSRKPFTVPLSSAALDVLQAARGVSNANGLVFPTVRGGKQLEANRLSRVVRPSGFTVHGMRSSFRDWCGETGVSRELAELSLAHAIGNETERAYFRSSLLEQRREVMEQWGQYLSA